MKTRKTKAIVINVSKNRARRIGTKGTMSIGTSTRKTYMRSNRITGTRRSKRSRNRTRLRRGRTRTRGPSGPGIGAGPQPG